MNTEVISYIEAIYLLYTFHFLRTSVDFGLGPSFHGYWLQHAVGNVKTRRICPFGRVAIIPFIILLILRNYVKVPRKLLIFAVLTAFLLSFMNTNATVYLLPVLIMEAFIAYDGSFYS
jgi:hypothetical protein